MLGTVLLQTFGRHAPVALLILFALSSAARRAETERMSVGSEGIEEDFWSERSSLSANGRFVAFGSPSSNLVPGDTNFYVDIFVCDRK